jgi:signal transduction histidine kinase
VPNVGTNERPHRWRWGWQAEVALAAGIAVLQVVGTSFAQRHQTGFRSLDVLGYLLLVAAPAAVLLRRRWPVAALAAAFAITLGYALLNYPDGPIWLPLVITFGSVLVSGHRLAGYLFLVGGYAAFTWLPNAVNDRPAPSMLQIVGLAAWLMLLAAVSELVRNRRAFRQANRERALAAQLSREEQAQRQASEERLRIARELHDVLAHSISMINVQAGVALELIEQRPEQARTALAAIKQASKDALVEVQAMLGSLRQPGEHVPRTPASSLADLDGLVQRAEAAGLTVRVEVSGEPVPLPAGVELAGFRIVQEALTNVVRHADASTATVRVQYGADGLGIEVDDDGHGQPGSTTANGGNGIPGMRERADALGGQLSAAPKAGGGFGVQARLPISTDQTVAP